MIYYFEGYGAGAPTGLQNQSYGFCLPKVTVVGSIPTTPLQIKPFKITNYVRYSLY